MKRTVHFLLAMIALSINVAASAGEPVESKDSAEATASKTTKKARKAEAESFELFRAMKEGVIEVDFFPKDATQATVVFKNTTDKPIDLDLPAAFGAIHERKALGQGYGGGMGGMGGGMGGMGGGMGGMGGGGMGGMGGGQGMGGGMGGGGMGGMGGMGGGMGGMFRVEPDKTRKLKVPCVCLEHGKKDPNPRMKYRLVPITEVNSDPKVAQLCSLLGNKQIPQNTAQAAAWHMANGLSWEQLAHKNRVESKYTGNVRFFNPVELRSAFQIANVIDRRYQQYQEASSEVSYGDSVGDQEASETAEEAASTN